MHQFLENWPNQVRFQGNYDLVQLLGCRVTLWPCGNNRRLHSWKLNWFCLQEENCIFGPGSDHLLLSVVWSSGYTRLAQFFRPTRSQGIESQKAFLLSPSGLLEKTVCPEIFIARAIFNNTPTLTSCWKFSEWSSGKYKTMCCPNSQPSQTENQWMTSEKQVAVWNVSFFVLSCFLVSFDSPSQAWTKMHCYFIMMKAGFEIMIQISRSSTVKCLLSGRISLAFLTKHSTGTFFFLCYSSESDIYGKLFYSLLTAFVVFHKIVFLLQDVFTSSNVLKR